MPHLIREHALNNFRLFSQGFATKKRSALALQVRCLLLEPRSKLAKHQIFRRNFNPFGGLGSLGFSFAKTLRNIIPTHYFFRTTYYENC